MTLADNKQLVLAFYERFTASDSAGAVSFLTDDATWWIVGKDNDPGVHGLLDKTQLKALLDGIFSVFALAGLRMTVKTIIGEGDMVAVEVVSYGPLPDGRVYENEYHTMFTFRDGKVIKVREFLDTHYVASFFHWGNRSTGPAT